MSRSERTWAIEKNVSIPARRVRRQQKQLEPAQTQVQNAPGSRSSIGESETRRRGGLGLTAALRTPTAHLQQNGVSIAARLAGSKRDGALMVEHREPYGWGCQVGPVDAMTPVRGDVEPVAGAEQVRLVLVGKSQFGGAG